MTAALTPQSALGWLRSLTVDVRAAAVLDADGAALAGDRELAGPPREPGLIVARSPAHAIVVRPGEHALTRVLEGDVAAALEALGHP